MKTAIVTLCAVLAATSASAQSLGDLFGQVQTNAKASAFDAVVGSQAPALSGLTENLSADQKAQLLDFGLDNAGTIGQVAAGASALGLGTGMMQQPAAPAPAYGTVAPTYQQPAAAAPVYGTVAPAYQQPSAPAPVYGTATPTYQQPIVPAYGTTTTTYAQPPVQAPAYGTTTQQTYAVPQQPAAVAAPAPTQQDMINGLIRMGLQSLGN